MSTFLYFSGQGIVQVASRNFAGVPQGFTDLGNCPALTIKPGKAGLRFATNNPLTPPRFGVDSGEMPSYSITVEDIRRENLSRFLLSLDTELPGANAFQETIGLFAGKKTPLTHMNASALYFAGHTEGVDFKLDYPSGTVESITLTGNYTVTYNYGPYRKFGAFTQAPPIVSLRFAGLNTLDGKPVVIDIFQTVLPPIDRMDFINDEILSYTLEGPMERDITRTDLQGDGYFYRIRMV